MSKNTYTATVNKAEVYDLMAEHAKVSLEANEVAFERMFESDEQDTEAQLASVKRELELATKANALAFHIADTFMSEEFVAGFQDHFASLAGNKN